MVSRDTYILGQCHLVIIAVVDKTNEKIVIRSELRAVEISRHYKHAMRMRKL